MGNPRVTITLPVYNAGKYLKECIDSILNQTFIDFELIIINDGSTDDSFEKISEYSDSRIVFINCSENKGLVNRLNQIIDIAKGEFIVRMDADDIMLPFRIEVQYNVLSVCVNDKDAVICCTNSFIIDKNGKLLGVSKFKYPKNKLDLFLGKYPMHPTIMAHISWFKKYGYRDFFRIEDLDLWYRSFYFTKYICVNQPTIFYRKESSLNSSSYFNTLKSVKKFIYCYNEFFYGLILYFKMCFMGIFKYVTR